MPRVEIESHTTLAPDQVVAALTDFSERRPEMWPGIAPEYYEVISVGENEAEVKEGTVMGPMRIWAVEHYDWSTPNRVLWTVKESNFSKPGSYVQIDLSPDGSGGSRIHTTWERTASTWWASLMFKMLVATKGKAVEQSVRKGLANYEREWAANS